MEFNPDPECPNCRAELNWPGSYNERSGVEFNCTMCGMEEGIHYVNVDEIPTEYLSRLFTYAERVDASIEMDGDSPRFDDLRVAVKAELEERGVSVQEVTLTHEVFTNKELANELKEEYPGFFTIGSPPPEKSYEFGTPMDEMEWESMVTADEAEELAQRDGVAVEAHN